MALHGHSKAQAAKIRARGVKRRGQATSRAARTGDKKAGRLGRTISGLRRKKK